jgi:hypothetical protein
MAFKLMLLPLRQPILQQREHEFKHKRPLKPLNEAHLRYLIKRKRLIKRSLRNLGGGKRAWWWEYYTVTTLTTTFEKGRGKTKLITPDEKYICKLCTNAKPFFRLASKLKRAATALKDHVEQKHRKYAKTEDNITKSGVPTRLQKYLKSAVEIPPFKEALVNWIVETCQPFTVTETESYKVMIKAAEYHNNIVKTDTLTTRVHDRVLAPDKDLVVLLDQTCSTIALSFDGWTSLNKLSMLAINRS